MLCWGCEGFIKVKVRYKYMALHFLPLFEHHDVFVLMGHHNKRKHGLFSNFCTTVISAGFCQKVECHNVMVRTLYNLILRIAKNLLETKENIKIASHPFYHIICDWCSWGWSKKKFTMADSKKTEFFKITNSQKKICEHFMDK